MLAMTMSWDRSLTYDDKYSTSSTSTSSQPGPVSPRKQQCCLHIIIHFAIIVARHQVMPAFTSDPFICMNISNI